MNAKVNLWKTHSEDDGERVFDKRMTKSENGSTMYLSLFVLHEGNK